MNILFVFKFCVFLESGSARSKYLSQVDSNATRSGCNQFDDEITNRNDDTQINVFIDVHSATCSRNVFGRLFWDSSIVGTLKCSLMRIITMRHFFQVLGIERAWSGAVNERIELRRWRREQFKNKRAFEILLISLVDKYFFEVHVLCFEFENQLLLQLGALECYFIGNL